MSVWQAHNLFVPQNSDIKIAWTKLVALPPRNNSIKENPPFDMHISIMSKC